MPTYKFKSNKTGDEYEEFMKISDLDNYIKENDVTQMVNGAPLLISGVNQKPDDSFRDVLREIKKKNSKGITQSTINTF